MLSYFDRLRELTGLEQDGAKLIDTMFSIDRPLLVLNGLCTQIAENPSIKALLPF